jgi:two-component system, LytTR family, response regulator
VEHAVEAFELNAVDYLLKPVTRVRLSQALDRVRKNETVKTQQGFNQLVRNREHGVSRFLVRRGAHYVVVPASRAAYFESVDGLTRMSGEGSIHLYRTWRLVLIRRSSTGSQEMRL